jgi:hypothetical protein
LRTQNFLRAEKRSLPSQTTAGFFIRHSGMRLLAQASDVQWHIGESRLAMVVMDSGLARFARAPE